MKYGHSVASIMVSGNEVNNSYVVILRTAFINDHGFISKSPAQAAQRAPQEHPEGRAGDICPRTPKTLHDTPQHP